MGWSKKLSRGLLCLALLVWPALAWCQTDTMYIDSWTEEEEGQYEGYRDALEEYEDEEPAIEQRGTLQTDNPTSPNQNLPKNTWDKAREGLNYSGTPEPKPEPSNLNLPDLSWLGPILQPLVVGVLIILIVLVIALAYRSATLNKRVTNGETVTSKTMLALEENLYDSDLAQALALAIQQENYEAAVRIYYLMVIKELSLRKHIQWKKDKTNGTYIREMVGNPLQASFKQITHAFEAVWYADATVNADKFQQLASAFEQFLQSLKNGAKP